MSIIARLPAATRSRRSGLRLTYPVVSAHGTPIGWDNRLVLRAHLVKRSQRCKTTTQ